MFTLRTMAPAIIPSRRRAPDLARYINFYFIVRAHTCAHTHAQVGGMKLAGVLTVFGCADQILRGLQIGALTPMLHSRNSRESQRAH